MNADACEPQEALPALSGGETNGAQARWSETGDRHAGTDADPVTANDPPTGRGSWIAMNEAQGPVAPRRGWPQQDGYISRYPEGYRYAERF